MSAERLTFPLFAVAIPDAPKAHGQPLTDPTEVNWLITDVDGSRCLVLFSNWNKLNEFCIATDRPGGGDCCIQLHAEHLLAVIEVIGPGSITVDPPSDGLITEFIDAGIIAAWIRSESRRLGR